MVRRRRRAPRPFTKEEDDRIRDLSRIGMSVDHWASHFPGRTFGELMERRLDLKTERPPLL